MRFFERIKAGIRHGPKYFFKDFRADPEWVKLMNFLGLDKDMDFEVMSEATYFTCIKLLSEAVGKLPLKLKHRDGAGNMFDARDRELFNTVNCRPNPYQSATSFWSTVEFMRNHYGNAYVLVTGFGDRQKLWILDSEQMEIWYDNAMMLSDERNKIWYVYNGPDKKYQFDPDVILHFKSSTSFNGGITGKSVRDILRDTVLSAKKAQKVLNKLYSNGFTAKAVLQYTADLSKENEKKLLQHIEKFARSDLADEGIENIIPIPLGASLQPLNIKLTDSQFVEVKQYTAVQIAAAFGIKPQQIGDYTKSSYASAEAQALSFYVDTLLYIVKQYEEELTYKLLTDDEIKSGLYFKFNIDVILRADFSTKVQALSTAVNSFLMTPNEARQKLDYGKVEGGDRLLGNGASIPVELTGSQYTNNEEGGETDGKHDETGNSEAPDSGGLGSEENQ